MTIVDDRSGTWSFSMVLDEQRVFQKGYMYNIEIHIWRKQFWYDALWNLTDRHRISFGLPRVQGGSESPVDLAPLPATVSSKVTGNPRTKWRFEYLQWSIRINGSFFYVFNDPEGKSWNPIIDDPWAQLGIHPGSQILCWRSPQVGIPIGTCGWNPRSWSTERSPKKQV